ncbi:MAG: hypothetical protein U0457_21875 [Candidatus Sericytochromatia bacterium]
MISNIYNFINDSNLKQLFYDFYDNYPEQFNSINALKIETIDDFKTFENLLLIKKPFYNNLKDLFLEVIALIILEKIKKNINPNKKTIFFFDSFNIGNSVIYNELIISMIRNVERYNYKYNIFFLSLYDFSDKYIYNEISQYVYKITITFDVFKYISNISDLCFSEHPVIFEYINSKNKCSLTHGNIALPATEEKLQGKVEKNLSNIDFLFSNHYYTYLFKSNIFKNKYCIVESGSPKNDKYYKKEREPYLNTKNIITYSPISQTHPKLDNFKSLKNLFDLVKVVSEKLTNYELHIRIFPYDRNNSVYKELKENISSYKNILIEDEKIQSTDSYIKSKIWLTDGSSGAFSFMIATGRAPIIVIDDFKNISNEHYLNCALEGAIVINNFYELPSAIELLENNVEEYVNKVDKFINKYTPNLGRAIDSIWENIESIINTGFPIKYKTANVFNYINYFIFDFINKLALNLDNFHIFNDINDLDISNNKYKILILEELSIGISDIEKINDYIDLVIVFKKDDYNFLLENKVIKRKIFFSDIVSIPNINKRDYYKNILKKNKLIEDDSKLVLFIIEKETDITFLLDNMSFLDKIKVLIKIKWKKDEYSFSILENIINTFENFSDNILILDNLIANGILSNFGIEDSYVISDYFVFLSNNTKNNILEAVLADINVVLLSEFLIEDKLTQSKNILKISNIKDFFNKLEQEEIYSKINLSLDKILNSNLLEELINYPSVSNKKELVNFIYNKAKELYANSFFLEAKDLLLELLHYFDNDIEAKKLLLEINIKLGNYIEVVELFYELIELDESFLAEEKLLQLKKYLTLLDYKDDLILLEENFGI